MLILPLKGFFDVFVRQIDGQIDVRSDCSTLPALQARGKISTATSQIHAFMVIFLQLEEKEVLRRLLPQRFKIWKKKKDQRLGKKAKAREEKLKAWVSL